MKFEIEFTSFLYLLGGIQVLFITGYLFFKRNNRTSISIYLSIILLGLFFTLYDYFVLQNNLQRSVSPFILISYIFQLAYAPSLYLLIKEIVSPQRQVQKLELFHFLPAALHFLYGIITFHAYSLEFKMKYIEQSLVLLETGGDEISPAYLVFNIFIAIQLIIYLYWSYQLIKRYKPSKGVQNPASLKTVKTLFFSLAVINVILILSSLNILRLLSSLSGYNLGLLVLIFFSLYLFYIAYFIILHPEVFAISIDKYKSTSLDKSQKKNILQTLQSYMQKHKPFRNEKLTIMELSVQVDIPVRQLSRVINEEYECNFYDFINYYRIKEAKELLTQEDKSRTYIMGIAYEVGFNSKSSFYSAFKKFTGTTPSAYQKNKTNS